MKQTHTMGSAYEWCKKFRFRLYNEINRLLWTDVQAYLAYAQALVTGEEVSPKPREGGRADAAL